MLTDPKILGKMEKIEERYEALRFRVVAKVQAQYAETTEHFRQEPILPYKPARRGMAWGGDGITCWFCGEVAVPRGLAGKPLFLRAGTNAETLLFVNGNPRGVFDANHPVVRITHGAPAGKRIRVALEAYAGHYVPGTQPGETRPAIEKGCKTFEGLELLLERPEVSRFVFDLRTLRQIANCLDEHSLRKGRILGGLKAVFAAVQAMPDPEDEEAWLPGIREALGIMAPLLALENGPTTPVFGIFGHSHIDTAWQWTIAETWRKCARTFSSVLNLMDQYPQFIFMQSAPYHAERMRDLYPAVFEGMRMKAEAGQWEPNGAMYIEPDCNIPAGESFVRQLLVGQRTQLELFGTYSDTLWLPDVFGYSAALPQLLRQARVRYFCTSKLSWNDTNRFPYDTFLWKGIDGTAVVSHFHRIHCWPDPETLTEFWNLVQHPDAQDRMLCPFGYGDGGGGPMAEMIEMGERARDVEGCPRAEFTTLSDFMAGIERELGAELPVHSGELYLELHRGTLTSVAEIKRGNRVLEQELLALEKLAAYGRGGPAGGVGPGLEGIPGAAVPRHPARLLHGPGERRGAGGLCPADGVGAGPAAADDGRAGRGGAGRSPVQHPLLALCGAGLRAGVGNRSGRRGLPASGEANRGTGHGGTGAVARGGGRELQPRPGGGKTLALLGGGRPGGNALCRGTLRRCGRHRLL